VALVPAFLASAVASFALALFAASFLGPDGFGRYAIAASLATSLSLGLFEWLRLSTTRFYSDADADVRLALYRGYAAMAAGLALLGALAVAFADRTGLSGGLLAAAAGAALALGFFDFRAALARARFDDRAYLRLTLTRAAGCSRWPARWQR
jgi:O-antigen/teichoic acid export membrane protein